MTDRGRTKVLAETSSRRMQYGTWLHFPGARRGRSGRMGIWAKNTASTSTGLRGHTDTMITNCRTEMADAR